MKLFTLKKIYNNYDKELEGLITINQKQQQQIRNVQLKMLKQVMQICDRNNIQIMLGGGSLLGAIRHKGFIPWDDDIDLMITRNNFEKFLKIIDEIHDCEFQFLENSSYSTFAKLVNKNSILIEMGCENIPKRNGIYLDIFIIENIPDNWFKRLLHGFKCNYMQLVCSALVMYSYPSKYTLKIFGNSALGKLNLFIRKIIKIKYSKQNINEYFEKTDKSFKRYSKYKTKHVSIPSGRGHYFGEILSRDIFENLEKVKFEGLDVYIPKEYNIYLKNLYGENYMEIPPEEKREKHYCLSFCIRED